MTDCYRGSREQDWTTPQWFFDLLDGEFHFTLDACADLTNAKCSRYFTIEQDGLAQDWSGETVWMNPPYGRGTVKWMEKALASAEAGATVVCLVPARTDTAWWHDIALRGEVRFLRNRLYFERGAERGRAPFPSAVIVFRNGGVAAKRERELLVTMVSVENTQHEG